MRVLASHRRNHSLCPIPPPPGDLSAAQISTSGNQTFWVGLDECGDMKFCPWRESHSTVRKENMFCVFRMSHSAPAQRAVSVVITLQRASTLYAAAKTFAPLPCGV